ncbi:YchJ family protein [Catenovulum adriaticum]|uniref:YchJ family protein n=1 Tax=Catenovulum adriaticum TaxID=2984846 RepID=A0ABY7ASY8_9ALTE|nr:YchJ family protein [Catenovulum sp. TS8]WAJ71494.1 YchJ family protein [Catenovulum sp. TS8]
MLCPCQSNLPFEQCCEPFINQTQRPETAEQLMRSRYSAYQQAKVDYIYQTQAPDTRDKNLLAEINRFAKSVQFIGLTVIADRVKTENSAEVEFIARYIDANDLVEMQECSQFIKLEGAWYYTEGQLAVKRKAISKNQACACGSGKKFKRCCAAKY